MPESLKIPVSSPADPVLVEVTRAGLVESRHSGALCIADSRGEIVAALGDVEVAVFPRSSYKMLQALPLIETGAADAFGVTDRELALACASHNGEPGHVEAVRGWLARIGCSEDDLACGAHRPYHEGSTDDLVRQGHAPRRAHNNCSGKHAGFLTVCRHLGLPIAGYARPDHPVQRMACDAIAGMTGIAADAMVNGIDGCSAPALAFPLSGLARAFAGIAAPETLADGTRAAAVLRLYRAVTGEPWFVAGTGRSCTVLMQAAEGRAALKTGAEGVFTAAIPAGDGRPALGVAVKIADGATRASECVISELLVRLGVVTADTEGVADFRTPAIRSRAGEEAGAIRAAEALSHLALPV
ncbi:asparaginase [Futiania mangrovi]|uniref:Asparaginase n=1 Tax=Futiania mangrovi TaxID=2959716 RepID=A0A9J6PFN4_9PROT|nr:asparaginase [Futiania mangrovii]MCP1336611.1 asparaginase [Futiania mangrovii]